MKAAIKYRDGYKYQLAEDYVVSTGIGLKADSGDHDFLSMTADGWLTVREGYAWDGPSGWTVDTKSSMRGSLVHDALYQLMREDLIPMSCRPAADELLYKICVEDGMWGWRAWLWLKAVRGFAGGAAMPENSKKVVVAP